MAFTATPSRSPSLASSIFVAAVRYPNGCTDSTSSAELSQPLARRSTECWYLVRTLVGLFTSSHLARTRASVIPESCKTFTARLESSPPASPLLPFRGPLRGDEGAGHGGDAAPLHRRRVPGRGRGGPLAGRGGRPAGRPGPAAGAVARPVLSREHRGAGPIA